MSDYLIESIALFVDVCFLFFHLKEYIRYSNAVPMIKHAPVVHLDENLVNVLTTLPFARLSYVAIHGQIAPYGKAISSIAFPDVTGVVQLLSLTEYGSSDVRLFNDSKRVVRNTLNVIPFYLKSHGYDVAIAKPLSADILDMDVISNTFAERITGVFDDFWGPIMFEKHRLVIKEEMLRVGTSITAYGELVIRNNKLVIQPPSNGGPYCLTTMHVNNLVRSLSTSKRNYGYICILLGIVACLLGTILYKKYKNNHN